MAQIVPELDGLCAQVLPFHAYFTQFLPRLLHVWLLLAVYGFCIDRHAHKLLRPIFAFVALLSCLGHKEVR